MPVCEPYTGTPVPVPSLSAQRRFIVENDYYGFSEAATVKQLVHEGVTPAVAERQVSVYKDQNLTFNWEE